MSNQAKANSRGKRIAKARNMRKNNGVGRTARNTEIFNVKHASDAPKGIGSRLASGLKGLLGK